jgi:hypothetical protein
MNDNMPELESIAADIDTLFAKKPGGEAQHLVSAKDDYAVCGVGLGDKANRSDTPGPFDPLCGNCRRIIEGDRKCSELSSLSEEL